MLLGEGQSPEKIASLGKPFVSSGDRLANLPGRVTHQDVFVKALVLLLDQALLQRDLFAQVADVLG